jgi:hypothetical protein
LKVGLDHAGGADGIGETLGLQLICFGFFHNKV